MGELLARAFTEQALLDAWDDVRESALADGEGGPEVDRFEAAAARKISQLAESLTDGSYSPHPVMRVDIAKHGGGIRRLAVPVLADRIVERALLAELDPVIDPLLLPWSFAYRRGLGVRDALACLVEAREAGAAWVARADINDCFDCIPRWEVLRRLREVVPDTQAVDLVRRLMDRPVTGERVPRADRGLGLHQGSALSPLLCNLYLDAFDRAMLAGGYRVIRYSDDMAIPAVDRAGAERALADTSEALAGLRLDLFPVKSHVASFDDGVPFLGSTVTALTSPGAMALSHPMETVVDGTFIWTPNHDQRPRSLPPPSVVATIPADPELRIGVERPKRSLWTNDLDGRRSLTLPAGNHQELPGDGRHGHGM